MDTKQKIGVGIFTVATWMACIVIKHFVPDAAADLSTVMTLAQAVLVGLGVTHLSDTATAKKDAAANPPDYPADKA
jgi:hypothetical protein